MIALIAPALLCSVALGPAAALPVVADSYTVVVTNRVVLDIAAPAALIWTYLPSIRTRPNMEKVSLNGLGDQYGSRFDTIFRDSTGTVIRHDRVEVLHWEPGVRYVAHVRYLPPAAPIDIIYNVDLHESAGTTHFVMDSYSTFTLPSTGTDLDRVARQAAARQEAQDYVIKAYEGLKREIETAVKR